MQSYDLIFLGGGVSALMVSRYLKIQNPKLKILILEKNLITRHNPGESTVGVAGLFFIRDLQLSTYCYLNHLPKNGLRFFFQDQSKQFDLETCSEVGSNIIPIFPTFQLDRKQLDSDLRQLNSEIGIQIELGAKITDIQLSKDSIHTITWSKNDKSFQSTSTWLINSLGRANNQFQFFNDISPKTKLTSHKTAGAWGRFTNVKDLDLMGSQDWIKKVGYTSRYLSTNHVMGEGFWIWLIPLKSGVVSIGIVYDYEIIQDDLQSKQSFIEYLNKHPFMKLLLDSAEIIDFQCAPHLANKRAQFAFDNKFCFLSESFGFVDPLYSPGSDVIARQAYLIEHMINATDDDLAQTVNTVNQYIDLEHEIISRLYINQYKAFGCYEVFNIKSLWDFHSYTNRMVWNFYDKKFQDLDWIKRQVNATSPTLKLTIAMQNAFIDLYDYLKSKGLDQRKNQHEYSARQNRFKIEEDMLVQYDDDRAIIEHLHLCRFTICEVLLARFNQNFDRHIFHELLNFSLIQNFKLTPEFVEKLLKKASKKLSKSILKQFKVSLEVELELSDLSKSLPVSMLQESLEVKTFVEKLWTQKSSNLLKDSMPKSHH
ncbi:MAG: tryptophan 7-halogenase [Candidatus Cloacimonetes bacterium]|nr:tryptophan 7-halogenase [Candidatus Cloacimonadota bacterium]